MRRSLLVTQTILACFGQIAITIPAAASTAQMGYITGVYGTINGAVLFNSSGSRTTPPACQGPGLGQRFALDASSVAGQAQIQVLIAAYQQHRRIYVGGQGTCSIWGDTETATYIQVEDGYPSSGRYSRSGHISSTFLSSADNEAFRVTLDTPMTECAYNFAYVNSSASNYNAYVANLMSAYYAGKAVSLFYGVDASGFCEIIEYSVN